MHAFGCLSNIFVLDFICSWLGLKDIGRLDASFCVKDKLFCEKCFIENNVLLPVLKQQQTLFKGNFGFLCWFVARINIQAGETNRFALNLQWTEWELLLFASIQNFATKSSIIHFLNNMHGLSVIDLSSEDAEILTLQILMESNNLNEFSLLNAQQPFDDLLCGVVAYCPNITKFSCANSLFVKQESVITICRECKQLTELNTENCTNMSKHLLYCCVAHCQKLTSLNIKGCTKIKKNELMILAYYSRKKFVSFKTSSDISDFSFELITNQWGSTLKKLEIESQRDDYYFADEDNTVFITDRSIEKMSETLLPNLTHLSLFNNQNLTHKSVVSIAQHLLNLEYLNIANIKLYISTLDVMSENLTNIKSLVISDFYIGPNNTYRSPLIDSIRIGDKELTVYLISKGVNVNVYDKETLESALLIAQKVVVEEIFDDELPELFEFLIEYGADVNHKNQNGNTALLIAVYLGHLKQVQQLIAAKADLEIKNKDGFTALQCAKQQYSIYSSSIISELVRAGADTSPPEGYIDSEICMFY